MLSPTDMQTITKSFMGIVASQLASETGDEAKRAKIMRGLDIAEHRTVAKSHPECWEVEGSKGTTYSVWNGECSCPSAKQDKLCKHRYAIGIVIKATKMAEARCAKARYARLGEASGIVWPVTETDLMFLDLDTGQTTYLDPQAAFGRTAELYMGGRVDE